MFIWGWTSRRKVLREGVFHSPAAGHDAPYQLVETRRWLTFCFVPVLAMEVIGEHVECRLTGSTYDPDILDRPTDTELSELLRAAVRASVAAVALADDVVSPCERDVAIAVLREFDADYDAVDLECDLEDVGIAPLEELLATLSTSLNEHGRERVLACAARVMSASGGASEWTVREVFTIGRALGMSGPHIDGVVLSAESVGQ